MFKNNVEVHGSYITGNITNSLERNEAEFRIKLFFSTTPNNLKTYLFTMSYTFWTR